jgi:hypothetical protein
MMPRPRPRPGRRPQRKGPVVPRWLVISLIVLVAAMMATAFLVGVFNPHYQTPPELSLLFSTIMGALVYTLRDRRDDDDEDER